MDLRTGAFGLWAAASGDPARRALVRGVDGADSWATDLHKMLNVPYESALVAVRDGRALHSSMASAAPYLPAAGPDAALPPELQNSRRARGVAAWAALQQLGADGVAGLVDGCCDHAARLASLLQRGGTGIVAPIVFNQALVRFRNDDVTAAVAAAAQRDGRCWVAATQYHGRTVIRISVSCAATTDGDVEAAARAILACNKELKPPVFEGRGGAPDPDVIAFIEGGPPPPPTDVPTALQPRCRELFLEHIRPVLERSAHGNAE